MNYPIGIPADQSLGTFVAVGGMLCLIAWALIESKIERKRKARGCIMSLEAVLSNLEELRVILPDDLNESCYQESDIELLDRAISGLKEELGYEEPTEADPSTSE